MAALQQQVTQLAAACETLHATSPDKGAGQRRHAADVWITGFQQTKEAWQVCEAVLSAPQTSTINVQFTAAQTLNRKMRYDLPQLPASAHGALRDSLLNLLLQRTKGEGAFVAASAPVVTQLCLGVAALSLQMPAWTGVVASLVGMFESQGPGALPCLLQLLQVIPEEYMDRSIDVPMTRRDDFCADFQGAASDVLRFLLDAMGRSGGDARVQERVFRCLRAWVTYGDVPAAEFAANPLLPAIFDAMASPQLFDAAVEVLIEVLHAYSSHRPVDLGVIQIVVPRVFGLKERYDRAVAGEDEEEAMSLSRVFCHMSDAYIKFILGKEEMNQVQLVQLVLECFKHPSYEVAQKSMYFWDTFLEQLPRLHPPEVRRVRLAQLSPLVQELVAVALQRVAYPPGFFDPDEFPADQCEEFLSHRGEVGEVLVKCCKTLGEAEVLRLLGQALGEAGQRFGQLSAEEGAKLANWAPLEAVLYAVQALGKAVCDNAMSGTADEDKQKLSNDCVSGLLGMLPQVPTGSCHNIRATATRIFGAYAQWVAIQSTVSSTHLLAGVQYACDGLAQPPVCVAAAYTLRMLCDYGRKPLAEQFASQVLSIGSSPAVAALPLPALLNLTEGLAYVTSSMPYAASAASTEQLATPPALQLQALVAVREQAAAAEGNPAALAAVAVPPVKDVVVALERLVVLLRYVRPVRNEATEPPIVLAILSTLWPALQSAAYLYPTSERVVEKLCRLLKHAMRAAKPQELASLVEPLLDVVVAAYGRSPMSPYMYAAGIAVGEFSRVSGGAFVPKLVESLSAMCTKTFSFLTSFEQFTEQPDIVEDLYIMADRFVSKVPEKVFAMPVFAALFQCAVSACLIQHREANRAVLIFVENTLSCALPSRNNPTPELFRPVVEQLFQANGQALLANLMAGVTGGLTADRVSDRDGSLASCLCCIKDLMNNTGSFLQLLQQGIKASPECAHVQEQDIAAFLRNLNEILMASQRMNYKFDKAIVEFSDRTRRRKAAA